MRSSLLKSAASRQRGCKCDNSSSFTRPPRFLLGTPLRRRRRAWLSHAGQQSYGEPENREESSLDGAVVWRVSRLPSPFGAVRGWWQRSPAQCPYASRSCVVVFWLLPTPTRRSSAVVDRHREPASVG